MDENYFMKLLTVAEIFNLITALCRDLNVDTDQYESLTHMMKCIDDGKNSKYKSYYLFQHHQQIEDALINLKLKDLKIENDETFHFAMICFVFFQIFNFDTCSEFTSQSELFSGYSKLFEEFIQMPDLLQNKMKEFYSARSKESQFALIDYYKSEPPNLVLQRVWNAFLAQTYLKFDYNEVKDQSNKLPVLNPDYTISYEDSPQIEPATIYVSFKENQAYFKMLTWTGKKIDEHHSMITDDFPPSPLFEVKLKKQLAHLKLIPYLTKQQESLQLKFEQIESMLALETFRVTKEKQEKAKPWRLRDNMFLNPILGKAQPNSDVIAQYDGILGDIQSQTHLVSTRSQQFINDTKYYNFMCQLLNEHYIELDLFLQGFEKQMINSTDIQFDFETMNAYFEKITFLQSRPELQYDRVLDDGFNEEVISINPQFYQSNLRPLIQAEKKTFQTAKEEQQKLFLDLSKRKNDILKNLGQPSFRAYELKSMPWFDKIASLAFHAALCGLGVVALSFSPQILAILAVQMSLPILQALIGLVLVYEGYQMFKAINNCFHITSIIHSNAPHQAGIAPPTPNSSFAFSMTA
jgi:hypothetical protein